ncbi:hypothetical protein EDB86DRAFT_512392 [Lactarius hatsudake]|nr:hypothetical protein EDB86DRAFT_512392 [Lactarius hatsudake]
MLKGVSRGELMKILSALSVVTTESSPTNSTPSACSYLRMARWQPWSNWHVWSLQNHVSTRTELCHWLSKYLELLPHTTKQGTSFEDCRSVIRRQVLIQNPAASVRYDLEKYRTRGISAMIHPHYFEKQGALKSCLQNIRIRYHHQHLLGWLRHDETLPCILQGTHTDS